MSMKLFLLLYLLRAVNAGCMTNCTCYLDNKGRKSVLCKDGGDVKPLSLDDLSKSTEVLKITAPEDNMNVFTMGPVFGEFKQLEEIHITRSNIPQLGVHFFWGLTKLEVLNLSQNNITQPLESNFRGLQRLKELYLDDNRIISLPSSTFRYLHELKVLSVQRNRIKELTPSVFLGIGKLKVLKLSGNSLGELHPEVFKDVQELRTLDCRGCAFRRVNNDIYSLLPSLTHLDLGENELESISSDELVNLKILRHLKLDGNQIASIDANTFVHQTELKRLNLARNAISVISPDAFTNLYNLTDIDLSYNKLEWLAADVFEPVAANLNVLVLSGNHLHLDDLKKVLENLQITELRLSDSGIFEITAPVFPSSLVSLDLSGNHLSSLRCDVLPDLQNLDISRNKFRGLDDNILNKIDDIQVIKLDANPWSCDLCHIIPIIDRVNRSAYYQNIICARPFIVEGKRLETLQRNQLTWCTTSYSNGDANFFLLGDSSHIGIVAAGMSVCLLLLTVFVIIGAICYSRRHAARYYTHEEKFAMEGESIFESPSPLFGEDRELSFKFPLDTNSEKKISIATIDEIKKEHKITANET